MLQNLLANAIRHTPADGTVRVQPYRGRRRSSSVKDTGEGIDAEAIERVFEPFWRGDAARTGEGTGLGLALAKRSWSRSAAGSRWSRSPRPAPGLPSSPRRQVKAAP